MLPIQTPDNLFHDGVPGGELGTLLTSAWLNAMQAENLSIMAAAGIVPSAATNQILQAIQSAALTGGRLLNVQVFAASGTYTPTPGTRSVVVEMVGGGGAGAGAPPTAAAQSSLGSGGGSGSYAKGRFTAGFSGVAVTVGAGGAAVLGANGGVGGTTSFGSLMSCPGGNGGLIGGPLANTSIPIFAPSGNQGGAPLGGNIEAAPGSLGGMGLAVASGMLGGNGAPSRFGGGVRGSGNGIAGVAGNAPGSGGGGSALGASGGALPGGPGATGLVIVLEYA